MVGSLSNSHKNRLNCKECTEAYIKSSLFKIIKKKRKKYGGNMNACFVRQIGIQIIRILDNFTFLDPWWVVGGGGGGGGSLSLF